MLFANICPFARGPRRLFGLLASSFLAAVLTGCGLMPAGCWCNREPDDPPIKDVMAYWDDHIHITTNTQNQGTLPGLAGRVWLQGAEVRQMEEARGKIVVELYDMTAGPDGAKAKPLVAVTYGRADLPKFKRKDMIGDGYTVFVPWETYRPDIKEVKLQVYYMPDKGPAQHGNVTTLTLRPAEQPQIEGHQQVTPASYVADKK